MVGDALWGSVSLAAYLVGCLSVGVASLRLLAGPSHSWSAVSPFARTSTAFILGQGLLSQVLVLLGLVVDFTPALVWAVLAASIALGVRPLRAELRETFSTSLVSVREWRGETLVGQTLALVTIGLLALLALAAIVFPPIGDGEAFYFVYGKFIAAGARLAPLTGNYEPFSTIGLVGEVHFAALMSLANPGAAKLFVWFVAVTACVLLAEIGRTCGLGSRGRLAVVVLVLTSSTFALYITDGKVDLFAAALGLGAYLWLLIPDRDVPARVPAGTAGLLAGLACVAKFSYLPVLVPGVLAILLLKPMPDASTRFRTVLAFGVAAAIAALPHLVKNGVFFGEPFAPFVTASPDRSWISQTWFSPEATAWIVKTYPLALVFGEYPMQGGTISYVWLAFLPLVFLLPRAHWTHASPLALATLAGMIGLVFWVALRPSVIAPRYILAPLLLLLLPVARAIELVSAPGTRARGLDLAVIVTLAIALAATIEPYWNLPREAVAVLRGRLGVCHRAHIFCFDLEPVNQLAKPGERAFLNLYQTYWLRPDLLLCRNTARESDLFKDTHRDSGLWAELFERGFSLVIVDKVSHRRELERLAAEQPPPWLDVRADLAGTRLAVYRIVSRDSGRVPEARCERGPHGTWRVIEGSSR